MQELSDQDVIWVKSLGDDKGFGKMSLLRLKKKTPNTIDAGTKITGNIQSENNWTISGTLIGDLMVTGDVLIERTADIKGDVIGENVWVAGKVTGNIAARNKLYITSASTIEGDISYRTLRIEEGAYIDGKMEHAEVTLDEGEDSISQARSSQVVQSPIHAQTLIKEPALPIRNKRVMIQ